MKQLLKQVGPFTSKARADRFGTLVDSIISQQISTSAANTIRNRLSEAVIARAAQLKQPTTTVTAENLLLFDLEELRQFGVSRQKGTYILDLAEKVQTGAVDLKSMSRKSDEAAIDELIQVKGIGRWTAQMFLIFSLARMDVLPVDDLGIKNAIQKQYALGELPSAKQIEELAVPWRPYATIASWYLWRSLETGS